MFVDERCTVWYILRWNKFCLRFYCMNLILQCKIDSTILQSELRLKRHFKHSLVIGIVVMLCHVGHEKKAGVALFANIDLVQLERFPHAIISPHPAMRYIILLYKKYGAMF